MSTRVHWILVGCFSLAWLAVGLTHPLHNQDFFPLWYAPQQLAHGLSPYGPAGTADLARVWQIGVPTNLDAGNAYPLPMILLLAPFALLPYALADALMLALGAGLVVWVGRRWAGGSGWVAVAVLGSAPLLQAAGGGNVTVLWLGFTLLAIWWLEQGHGGRAGALLPVLLLKPQVGLLVAVIGGLILLRRRSGRGVLAMLGSALVLGGGSLLIDPHWIGAWLGQVATYAAILTPVHVPLAVWVSVVALYKRPWWVAAGLLTVLLLPQVAFYSLLPLVLVWVDRPGWWAVGALAAGWIYYLVPDASWAVLFLPVIGAGLTTIVQDLLGRPQAVSQRSRSPLKDG